jgi:hypothetical protein
VLRPLLHQTVSLIVELVLLLDAEVGRMSAAKPSATGVRKRAKHREILKAAPEEAGSHGKPRTAPTINSQRSALRANP